MTNELSKDEDMIMVDFAIKDSETDKTIKVVSEAVKDDNPNALWVELVEEAAERVCEEFIQETGREDVYAVEVP